MLQGKTNPFFLLYIHSSRFNIFIFCLYSNYLEFWIFFYLFIFYLKIYGEKVQSNCRCCFLTIQICLIQGGVILQRFKSIEKYFPKPDLIFQLKCLLCCVNTHLRPILDLYETDLIKKYFEVLCWSQYLFLVNKHPM